MPGINGIELLKQIKADPELRHITVVMMTGVSDEEQLRTAAAVGANSYTIKPANAEQFLKNGGRQHQLLVDHPPVSGPSPAARAVSALTR